MNLEIDISAPAIIATNVEEICSELMTQLQKYRGCISTPDTLKDDKKACTNINKLKKFIADERIAFDKRVAAMPAVQAVHDAMRLVELECDAIRGPYWESVKAIEDAGKAPDPVYDIDLTLKGVTLKQWESIQKKLQKDGIQYEQGGLAQVQK